MYYANVFLTPDLKSLILIVWLKELSALHWRCQSAPSHHHLLDVFQGKLTRAPPSTLSTIGLGMILLRPRGALSPTSLKILALRRRGKGILYSSHIGVFGRLCFVFMVCSRCSCASIRLSTFGLLFNLDCDIWPAPRHRINSASAPVLISCSGGYIKRKRDWLKSLASMRWLFVIKKKEATLRGRYALSLRSQHSSSIFKSW